MQMAAKIAMNNTGDGHRTGINRRATQECNTSPCKKSIILLLRMCCLKLNLRYLILPTDHSLKLVINFPFVAQFASISVLDFQPVAGPLLTIFQWGGGSNFEKGTVITTTIIYNKKYRVGGQCWSHAGDERGAFYPLTFYPMTFIP